MYKPAPGVRWTVEREGVQVCFAGGAVFLRYPQAAVWDLLARGQTVDEAIRKLRFIAALDPQAATQLVTDECRRWCSQGLLDG